MDLGLHMEVCVHSTLYMLCIHSILYLVSTLPLVIRAPIFLLDSTSSTFFELICLSLPPHRSLRLVVPAAKIAMHLFSVTRILVALVVATAATSTAAPLNDPFSIISHAF